jgi:hypothetical protein
MINEIERKEVVMASFKVLYWSSSGETKENHKKP